MNTETRDSISRAVEILQGHLSGIDANEASITANKVAAAELEKRRGNLEATSGSPDALESLMAEIGRTNVQLERLNVQRQELCLAMDKDLVAIVPQAQVVLGQLYKQSLAVAVAQIRPLVATDKEAQRQAATYVECKNLRRAVTGLGVGQWQHAERNARAIVRYYEAALQAS